MRILVSNDDGFHAEGIQVLAKELRKIADVVKFHVTRKQRRIV